MVSESVRWKEVLINVPSFFVCGAWFCVWLKVAGEKIRGIMYIQHIMSSEKIMSQETIIHALFLLPVHAKEEYINKKNESAKIIMIACYYWVRYSTRQERVDWLHNGEHFGVENNAASITHHCFRRR